MDSWPPVPAHLPLGLIMVDSGRKVIFADERAAALLSFDRRKVLDRPWSEACPDAKIQNLMEGLSGGQPSLLEWNNRKLVLQTFDPDPGSHPGTIVLVQDVSAWHFLWDEFEKHREAARDLEAIFNSSFDEILVIDGKGIIQRINKAGETNYGLNVQEMIGISVSDLEHRGLFSPSVTSIVLRDQCRITITQETKIGKQLIVTGNPIFDDTGNIIRIVINSRDISELTNLKQKLEETELLAENYYKLILNLQQRKVVDAEIVCASPQMKRIIDLSDKVAP
ncbi:MAG TPA: PAS domain-containing protein, partial [Spirochaetia bacterium]|nr:PAS domain-containing protein [Spirochaetia bacterium]